MSLDVEIWRPPGGCCRSSLRERLEPARNCFRRVEHGAFVFGVSSQRTARPVAAATPEGLVNAEHGSDLSAALRFTTAHMTANASSTEHTSRLVPREKRNDDTFTALILLLIPASPQNVSVDQYRRVTSRRLPIEALPNRVFGSIPFAYAEGRARGPPCRKGPPL